MLLVESDRTLVQVTVVPDLMAGVSDLGANLRDRVDRVARDVESGVDLLARQQPEDAWNTDTRPELPSGYGRWRIDAEAAQPHRDRVEVEGQADGRS